MSHRSWKTEMTASERRQGLAFFLLYLLVFPRVNAWLQRLWMGDGEVLVAEANVIYYAFLFTLTLFIFWSFLKKDFLGLLDWLPENLFAAAVGLLLAGGLYAVLSLLPFPVRDPLSLQYAQEFRAAPLPILALILLLIPVVEETVYRGLSAAVCAPTAVLWPWGSARSSTPLPRFGGTPWTFPTPGICCWWCSICPCPPPSPGVMTGAAASGPVWSSMGGSTE